MTFCHLTGVEQFIDAGRMHAEQIARYSLQFLHGIIVFITADITCNSCMAMHSGKNQPHIVGSMGDSAE